MCWLDDAHEHVASECLSSLPLLRPTPVFPLACPSLCSPTRGPGVHAAQQPAHRGPCAGCGPVLGTPQDRGRVLHAHCVHRGPRGLHDGTRGRPRVTGGESPVASPASSAMTLLCTLSLGDVCLPSSRVDPCLIDCSCQVTAIPIGRNASRKVVTPAHRTGYAESLLPLPSPLPEDRTCCFRHHLTPALRLCWQCCCCHEHMRNHSTLQGLL